MKRSARVLASPHLNPCQAQSQPYVGQEAAADGSSFFFISHGLKYFEKALVFLVMQDEIGVDSKNAGTENFRH